MVTLYDDLRYDVDDVMDDLEADGYEATEKYAYDLISDMLEDDLEYAKSLVDEAFDGSRIWAFGTCQRWNGYYRGGSDYDDFDDFLSSVIDGVGYSYLTIICDNGHLYVTVSHHDGVNRYELKKMTKAGEAYIDNIRHRDFDPKTVNREMTKRYSRLPKIS